MIADQLAATVGEKLVEVSSSMLDFWLLLAEGHLTQRLFEAMVRRIAALPLPAG